MPEALDLSSPGRTFRRALPRERAIAELADRQHGVVGLAQLRSLGISASAVRNRAADGRLHRVHRGVYAVGRATLTRSGRYAAAVLACGPGAVLSHRSAADHAGLLRSDRAVVDVTVPGSPRRARVDVRVHGSATLTKADVTVVEGIPCTSVARILVDLGDCAPRRAVERALEQSEVLRSFDLAALEGALARAGRRKGVGVLRAVLRDLTGPTLTRSELEERFLALCRAASLPSPAVNAWVNTAGGALQVDFLWRAERLVVETDGRAFHATRRAFERDRRRDRRLKLAGFEPIRFTWREVVEEPAMVLGAMRDLLARLARP